MYSGVFLTCDGEHCCCKVVGLHGAVVSKLADESKIEGLGNRGTKTLAGPIRRSIASEETGPEDMDRSKRQCFDRFLELAFYLKIER